MSEYKSCPPDVDYIEVQGPAGPQGPQGLQGPKGVPGPAGPQGPQGLQGPEGCRGPKGDRGPRGEKGDPGRDGRDGAPGPQGPQGVEGPRGCKGNDGNVKFHELTQQQINMLKGPEGPEGPEGPQGIQGMTGPIGPKGDKGEPGATGPQGERGLTGPMGPRGEIGPQGLRGPAGPRGEGSQLAPNISATTTWSSKQITDYALHGKVEWEHHKGDDLGVEHTENGYVKNVKIWGRTLTNLVDKALNNKSIIINNEVFTTPKARIVLFDSTKGQEGVVPLGAKTYTFIYTMTRPSMLYLEDEMVQVIFTKSTGETETVNATLKDGIIKVPFTSDATITKVEAKLFTKIGLGEAYQVTFTAKDFILLEGNWTHGIAPDYFIGTKSTGDRKGVGASITVVSRGKNLIEPNFFSSDYYLKMSDANQGGTKPRWEVSTEKDTVTYLIYCRPQTSYSFSMEVAQEHLGDARLIIASFAEKPTNGAFGVQCAHRTSIISPNVTESFVTDEHAKLLAIYVAHLPVGHNAKEIIKKIQLEEGNAPTTYEEYKKQEKELELPRAIKEGEYLWWDDKTEALGQHKYKIHTSDGQDVDTNIMDEHIIHTFNGMTYLYIKSKIPSILEGEFPIKGHNDYFTKEETTQALSQQRLEITGQIMTEVQDNYYQKKDFAFEDAGENEDLNFLKLPGGFVMQWKTVPLNGGHAQEVDFKAITNLVHVQVCHYLSGQDQSITYPVYCRAKRDSVSGGGFPAVEIWGDSASVGTYAKAMVLAIGDNRRV